MARTPELCPSVFRTAKRVRLSRQLDVRLWHRLLNEPSLTAPNSNLFPITAVSRRWTARIMLCELQLPTLKKVLRDETDSAGLS